MREKRRRWNYNNKVGVREGGCRGHSCILERDTSLDYVYGNQYFD
jgi:hypothetical protein